MRRPEEIWEYRRIDGLIRKRVDDSPCTTREIIQHMKDEYSHEVKPYELQRALMRSDRIYKKSEMKVDGSLMSLWASTWNRTEEE